MKKIMYSMLALALATFTFTSCEDVPAPYEIPGGGNGGGSELPEGTFFEQDFSSSLGTFTSVSASGDIKWDNSYSSACITGYADWDGTGTKTNHAGVTYLISPEIDLTKAESAHVDLNHAMRYENGDINTNNSLLITDNYTGDVTTTTWTQLQYNTDGLNGTSFDFVTSQANIPATFVGKKVRVALRHTCGEKSSTWEVKTLQILNGNVELPSNPDTPSTGEAKGDGTKDNPFNSVAANKAASALASGAESDKEYYIKGKICEVKETFSTNYGNASFYITDDGTSTSDKFYCFRVLYLNNEKYTTGTNIAVGDEVVVCATLTNYLGNTPETVQNKGYLVELKSNGGGETPDTPAAGEGLTLDSTNGIVTMANSDVTDGESIEATVESLKLTGDDSAGQPVSEIKLSDGTVISFTDGGETNKPMYYHKYQSIRVYKNNGFTVKGVKKIARIILTCDGAKYVGNATAQLVFDGNNATYTNTYTEATGGGVQLRFKTIKIVYAK